MGKGAAGRKKEMKADDIRLGTSAFTAEGWSGSFYPKNLKPADFLTYYATKFDTVELDNTFYRTPSFAVVKSWNEKTPAGFIFAAKVPSLITHEKVLVDCETDLKQFLTTMDALGDKLGPLLFQFGYFNKSVFKTGLEFFARLRPFLKKLPRDRQFAVEIRNKYWLNADLADILRENNVALTLIDQSWVPRPWEMKNRFDLITSDFTYIRWLGDRKGIEKETKMWDKTIVDRTPDLTEWAKIVRKVHERKIRIFGFANNHYAGHGPGTLELFQRLLNQGV
jgi:uncharacterized protein YecE (DUF72 family)